MNSTSFGLSVQTTDPIKRSLRRRRPAVEAMEQLRVSVRLMSGEMQEGHWFGPLKNTKGGFLWIFLGFSLGFLRVFVGLFLGFLGFLWFFYGFS